MRFNRLQLCGTPPAEGTFDQRGVQVFVRYESLSQGDQDRVTEESILNLCSQFGSIEDVLIRRHNEVSISREKRIVLTSFIVLLPRRIIEISKRIWFCVFHEYSKHLFGWSWDTHRSWEGSFQVWVSSQDDESSFGGFLPEWVRSYKSSPFYPSEFIIFYFLYSKEPISESSWSSAIFWSLSGESFTLFFQ